VVDELHPEFIKEAKEQKKSSDPPSRGADSGSVSNRLVLLKGKGLEPLCEVLERLAVERIRLRPEKYEGLGKNEGVIEEIEVRKIDKNIAAD